MEEFVRSRLGAVARRERFVKTYEVLQKIIFFALAPLVILFLADRILYEAGASRALAFGPNVLPWALAAVLAGALAGGLASLSVRPNLESAAAMLDRREGTEELFRTAYEEGLGEERSRFTDALERRAARRIEKVVPSALLPLPATRYLAFLFVTLASASVLLALPGPRLAFPRADFVRVPERGTAPLDVEATAACAGHVNSVRWSWGDGGEDSGWTVRHAYRNPGKYAITLEATGPAGKDTASRWVEVLPPLHPVARFQPVPSTGRTPLEVQLRNGSENASQYVWDLGNGKLSREPSPVVRYEKPGNYFVRLTAFRGSLKDSAGAVVRVLDPEAPMADFAAHPTQGDPPLTVQFESRTTGVADSFEWDVGDEYAGGERIKLTKDPRHEYRVPGVYTVRLVARGPHGENEAVKEHFIRVGKPQGSGGGGGGGRADSGPSPKGGTSGSSRFRPGDKEGALFGEKKARPSVNLVPERVGAPFRGEELVEKNQSFYVPDDSGANREKPPEFRKLFGLYEKEAEETIEREQIGERDRKFVKEYFDLIRPKDR